MPFEGQCWRVKLYRLKKGVWGNQGTGFVSCEQMLWEGKDPPAYIGCLVVKKENTNAVILQSPIQYKDAYERQRDSIILWKENIGNNGIKVDYALSFEDEAGCYAIWDAINDVQGISQRLLDSHDLSPDDKFSGNSNTNGVPKAEGGVYESFERAGFRVEGISSPLALSPSHPLISNDDASSYIGLPAVTAENLRDICEKLHVAFPKQKEVYVSIILDKEGEYITNLLDLSESSRANGKILPCQKVAEIFKLIVFLNDQTILDFLVKDHDLFYRIAGAMEFDPLLKEEGKYQQMLDVCPGPTCIVGDNFGSSESSKSDRSDIGPEPKKVPTRNIVERLFRARLLKDCFVRPLLDESGAAALYGFIHSLQSDICTNIFNDLDYFQKILDHISQSLSGVNLLTDLENDFDDDSEDTSPNVDIKLSQLSSGLGFLRELFFMSRQLHFDHRNEMYSNFLEKIRAPFFSTLRNILCMRSSPDNAADSCSKARVMCAEIMSSVTQVCPSYLRQTIMEGAVPISGNDNDKCILFVIIERLCCDEETAVIEHLGEILKVLLDPERLDVLEKDRFLGLFYDYYAEWMILPFSNDDVSPDEMCSFRPHYSLEFQHGGSDAEDAVMFRRGSSSLLSSISSSRRLLCELFAQCVQCHSYQMKFFVVRNKVITRVFRLLKSRYRHLHIGPIKFVRSIIAVKDEFYYKHIVKYDLLRPMMELFYGSCSKDNLITSAIVEVFDFIRAERIATLINYIVESYRHVFTKCMESESGTLEKDMDRKNFDAKGLFYAPVFGKFLQTYEQAQEESISEFSVQLTDPQNSTDQSRRRINRCIAEQESEEAYFDEERDEIVGDEANHTDNGSAISSFIGSVAKWTNDVDESCDISGKKRTLCGNSDSLKMISDLYGGDDDDDSCEAQLLTADHIDRNMSSAESTDSEFCFSPPPGLPPLKSKFGSDTEEEAELENGSAFFQPKKFARSGSRPTLAHKSSKGKSGISFSVKINR